MEVDETYNRQNSDRGPKDAVPRRIGNMNCVRTLVDRDSDRSKSTVIEGFDAATMASLLSDTVARERA